MLISNPVATAPGTDLVQVQCVIREAKPQSQKSAHAIISRMSEDLRNEQITVRIIRDGSPEPPDDDWSMATPEERIEAVWTLTELCLAWNNPSTSVPRLQRTITRVQRARR